MRLVNIGLLFLIPSILEFHLGVLSGEGNMGLYGCILDIYNKRNIVYISTIVFFICYFYNFIILGIIFLIISLFLYYTSLNRWKYLFKDIL